ncbi:MAG TPA: M6 family metalloprotease domain-containing protein [Longimicrobium sp.]|nr:M6 family metalloprotease domain-containing protein [Longimicrobium sp.]
MRVRAALLAAAVLAAPAAGQDIEALSAASGVPLPAGYYARIRQNPDFFQTRREWRNLGAAAAVRMGDSVMAVAPRRGTLQMVVLMGLFADSPPPTVSAEAVQRQLFGDNPLGNLTEFYREISGGQMNIVGTVLPWVRTSRTVAEVAGTSFGLGDDAYVGGYLREVLARVDSTTNFGQFDSDGPDGIPNSGDDDGYVDLAVFQYAERAANCGSVSIWPHKSGISAWLGGPYSTNDLRPNGEPVRLDDYHMQSAVTCSGAPQSIATIAHETGHAFGLPDFYDASGGLLPASRRWVLGCWTLMAAGSWGCGDGAAVGDVDRPSHMGAYEKAILGWVAPIFTQPGWRRAYTLRPVQTSGDVLHVPLWGTHEFLMLEYRPNTGFDASLPAGGVLVYHVDLTRSLRISCNGCPRIYHAQLVEADGDSALVKTAAEGGNRGTAGDVFAGRRTLDDWTHPSIRLNNGVVSNVALEIEVAGGVARVLVSTLPIVASPRLLGPLLGSSGAAPTGDERAALDHFGNRNGGYDMGDLRAYMRARPGTVAQGA